MSFWARIENNRVGEVIDFDPTDRFHPSWVWAPCNALTQIGNAFDPETGTFYPPPPVMPTVTDYTAAVQRLLDAEAQAHGYDGILSAASYAAVAGPFQAEGIAFATYRSDCWAYCYAQLAAVQGGQRPQPSVDELLGELPALVLP